MAPASDESSLSGWYVITCTHSIENRTLIFYRRWQCRVCVHIKGIEGTGLNSNGWYTTYNTQHHTCRIQDTNEVTSFLHKQWTFNITMGQYPIRLLQFSSFNVTLSIGSVVRFEFYYSIYLCSIKLKFRFNNFQ